MAEGFRIDVEALRGLVPQLTAAATQVAPMAAELDGPAEAAATLNREYLTSAALQEFTAAWQETLDRLGTALQQHGETLTKNLDAYCGTDGSAGQTFDRMRSGFDA